MVYHIIFVIAYIFFAAFFLNQPVEAPLGLYCMPVAVYALLYAASFPAARMTGRKVKDVFRGFSPALAAFLVLFSAPFAVKADIPDPHNFLLRKLELTAAAGYIFYLIVLTVKFLHSMKDSEGGIIKEKFRNIVIFFFVFYFALSLWFNYANKPVGDEPSYLITAHSIVFDRDLDLKNNYENRDYKKFYDRELKPHEININGKLYSYHPVLFPAVISPFYLAAGRAGVTFFINLLAALICGLVYLLCARVFKEKSAVITSLLTGLSLPLLLFSNQVCTETLSGVLILGSFVIILFYREKFALLCVSAALVLWAHPRNIPLWGILCLLAVIEYRREIKKAAVFAGTQLLSAAMLFTFNFMIFGKFIPRQTQAEIPLSEAFKINITGMLGLFFDQEFGMLIYTPVFMLALAGAFFLYKKSRKVFYYSFFLFIPYFIMISSWLDWRGGGGSSPRFFVPVIFFFAFFTGAALDAVRDKASRVVFTALIAAGFLYSAVIMLVPWFRWNKGAGDNWVLKLISEAANTDFTALFPSLWAAPESSLITTAVWVVIAIAVNIFIVLRNR